MYINDNSKQTIIRKIKEIKLKKSVKEASKQAKEIKVINTINHLEMDIIDSEILFEENIEIKIKNKKNEKEINKFDLRKERPLKPELLKSKNK